MITYQVGMKTFSDYELAYTESQEADLGIAVFVNGVFSYEIDL